MSRPRKPPSPIREFEDELSSVLQKKPPVSKVKVQAVTELGMKHAKHFKLVVHAVEKFIHKARSEFKLPGLYFIDAIVRRSISKFKEKDMYRARFEKNLVQTFNHLLRCSAEDKEKMMKVVSMWKDKHVFSIEVLDNVVPTQRSPEAIQISAGAFSGSQIALPKAAADDDFDYGSDEDESDRIAEMQRTYTEQRAALDSQRSENSSTDLLASLSKLNDLAASVVGHHSQTTTSSAATQLPGQSMPDPRAAGSVTTDPSSLTHRALAKIADPRSADPRSADTRSADPRSEGRSVPLQRQRTADPPINTQQGPAAEGPAVGEPPLLLATSKSLRVTRLPQTVTKNQMDAFFHKAGPIFRTWMTGSEEGNTACCIYRDRKTAEAAYSAGKAFLEGRKGTIVEWMRSKAADSVRSPRVQWRPDSGEIAIPLDLINQANLRILCIDSVVNRKSAPPDMIPDLDRFEGNPGAAAPTDAQTDSNPARGAMNPTGTTGPVERPLHIRGERRSTDQWPPSAESHEEAQLRPRGAPPGAPLQRVPELQRQNPQVSGKKISFRIGYPGPASGGGDPYASVKHPPIVGNQPNAARLNDESAFSDLVRKNLPPGFIEDNSRQENGEPDRKKRRSRWSRDNDNGSSRRPERI